MYSLSNYINHAMMNVLNAHEGMEHIIIKLYTNTKQFLLICLVTNPSLTTFWQALECRT